MKAITQGADSGLSFDNAKSYVSATGLLAAGFLVAHNGLRLVKMQDNMLANLGLTAAAVAGAMYVSNPWLKLALIGVAAYAGVKTVSLAVAEVAAPGASGLNGISGMIPEGVKANIRKFLPTFDSVGEYDEMSGADDEMGDVNLDEHIGDVDENLMGNEEALLGEGAASSMI